MALFTYEAVTESGKTAKGFVTADSLDLAKKQLQQAGKFVVAVRPHVETKKEKQLTEDNKIEFTRDLASLLKAGLPLYEALKTIEEKYADQPIHHIYLDITDQVKHGKTLSDALKKHAACFDGVYVAIVQAGEQTGKLESVFTHLETLYVRQHKLKKQLQSALIYPAFLLSFAGVVIYVLLFVMVPMMKDFFEGRELHPLTQFILATSDFVTTHSLSLLFGCISLVTGLFLYFRSHSGKAFVEHVTLKLPIINTVLIQSSLLKFTRILSVLLSSGVPLLEALQLSRCVVKNKHLRNSLEEGELAALQGKSLADAYGQSPHFPTLFIRMIAVAEESGKMDVMLSSIADIYDEELERSLQRFTTMLQPALLLFLGIVVGIVLLAVLLPMTDVTSLIE